MFRGGTEGWKVAGVKIPVTITFVYVQESRLYRGMAKSENAPHIFAIADASYHSMLHQKTSQCIVISGESGAGKTESANFLLRQLVTLGKVKTSFSGSLLH